MAFLRRFLEALSQDELGMRAAALAYYATFSLFPLLLLVVSATGVVIDSQSLQQQIVNRVIEFLPGSENAIGQLIRQVIAVRAGIGVLGGLGLLWSASGFFGALESSVNTVFDIEDRRPVWRSRLIGIGMALLVLPLLLLATLSSSLTSALRSFPILPDWTSQLIAAGTNQAVSFLIIVLAFSLLYYFIPCRRPQKRPTLLGATLAALAWVVATRLFTWYLGSGFARFNVVYGSVGAIVALILWLYLSSFIILLGAELTDLLSRRPKAGENGGD